MKKKKTVKRTVHAARTEDHSAIIQIGVVFVIVFAMLLFAYVVKNFS